MLRHDRTCAPRAAGSDLRAHDHRGGGELAVVDLEKLAALLPFVVQLDPILERGDRQQLAVGDDDLARANEHRPLVGNDERALADGLDLGDREAFAPTRPDPPCDALDDSDAHTARATDVDLACALLQQRRTFDPARGLLLAKHHGTRVRLRKLIRENRVEQLGTPQRGCELRHVGVAQAQVELVAPELRFFVRRQQAIGQGSANGVLKGEQRSLSPVRARCTQRAAGERLEQPQVGSAALTGGHARSEA